MTFLLDTTARLSVPIAIALVGALALRRRSAATRHWFLAAGITCAALIPALQSTLPAWRIAVSPPAPRAASVTTSTMVVPMSTDGVGARRTAPEPSTAAWTIRPSAIVASIWAIGALLALSALGLGFSRLSRLAATARRLDGRTAEIAQEIGGAIGLRRPVAVLQSRDLALLVTWGFWRPKVLLPPSADSWSEERLRIVLRHELAHVRRYDWPAQMIAEMLRAVYWFNPLIWIAARRLRDAGEQACDDAVLNSGVEPARYAAHLLELARALSAMRRAPAPALAMAPPSRLEGRITAMLDARLNRRPLTMRARLAIATACLALTVPVAIVARGQFSTLSGTIVDQTDRVLPNVAVSLSNAATQTKHEVRSDRTGRFEFVGLPAGDYELRAAQPGFALLIQPVTIAGTDLTRNLKMEIGSVHETISVSLEPVVSGDPAARERQSEEAVVRARKFRQDAADRCAQASAPGEIGGNILAPLKLKDVKPVYPEQLKAAKVTGAVTLDAHITTDGTVRDVTAVSSPNPDFARAAIDAVRQWEFTTTYLNCTPIEVSMQVTINFIPGERK